MATRDFQRDVFDHFVKNIGGEVLSEFGDVKTAD